MYLCRFKFDDMDVVHVDMGLNKYDEDEDEDDDDEMKFHSINLKFTIFQSNYKQFQEIRYEVENDDEEEDFNNFKITFKKYIIGLKNRLTFNNYSSRFELRLDEKERELSLKYKENAEIFYIDDVFSDLVIERDDECIVCYENTIRKTKCCGKSYCLICFHKNASNNPDTRHKCPNCRQNVFSE
jgi:hypothetical protein